MQIQLAVEMEGQEFPLISLGLGLLMAAVVVGNTLVLLPPFMGREWAV
jgi:hypothetical protein